jgi:hypothetical protein
VREFPAFQARMTVFNVTKDGPRRVAQLRAGCEVAAEIRAGQEHLDAQTHLVGQPPGSDIPEVFERSHAAESCNPAARVYFAKSGLIANERIGWIEVFAIF